jgi:sulfite reductase (ferredoxin)
MKASNSLWRERLLDRMPAHLAKEIDIFENEIQLRKQGKIDEKVFAETRLRRGAYGQRYDNGQRHDGKVSRTLDYPSNPLTKGPSTFWDAPGMQRIKIPFGGLNAEQLETLAALAEEYSDGIAHITTRQDVQLHFVHIDDVPSLMRRLAAVGITTREACGNTVRNVTACPLAGVCKTQTFDVTPYAKATAYFMLGHPGTQDYGRKFKIGFSGCRDEACALVRIHDIGAIAVTRGGRRGFEFYVGGGLGSVPYQAKLFDEFIPEEELLPMCLAIGRVFSRLGERKNRQQARMKFVLVKLGMEEFKRQVAIERARLDPDPRWTDYLAEAHAFEEEPLKPPSLLQIQPAAPAGFDDWRRTNVYSQRQAGYATVTIALPLGDLTADQLRTVADLARRYVKETIRSTVEQNLVLRWVSESDLPALYAELQAAELATRGAGTIADVGACPGTDTCKLGIASSRGLAGELTRRLLPDLESLDPEIRKLRIKISGCFNSCGQHHVADIGFYGVSRNKNGYTVPHFQVVLGGEWTHNAGSYGLAIGAVPSKRVPDALARITTRYLAERTGEDSFQTFIKRIGKAECKRMLEDLMEVPPHAIDPSFYTDWADSREYTTGDMGMGECAGAVVSIAEFALTACEREAFEAQLSLEQGNVDRASQMAYEAMLHAARALLEWRELPFDPTPAGIAAAFRREFYDTELIFDRFNAGQFALHFFRAHEHAGQPYSADGAHRLVEETQLFIEACYACYGRLTANAATV